MNSEMTWEWPGHFFSKGRRGGEDIKLQLPPIHHISHKFIQQLGISNPKYLK